MVGELSGVDSNPNPDPDPNPTPQAGRPCAHGTAGPPRCPTMRSMLRSHGWARPSTRRRSTNPNPALTLTLTLTLYSNPSPNPNPNPNQDRAGAGAPHGGALRRSVEPSRKHSPPELLALQNSFERPATVGATAATGAVKNRSRVRKRRTLQQRGSSPNEQQAAGSGEGSGGEDDGGEVQQPAH